MVNMLTWGPFTVYHSQLRTPNGRYDGPQQDRALIITYQRDIDREAPEIAAAPDIALPLRVKLQSAKPYAIPEACSAV